jgi:UDP-N-acetylglucosamine 3-dehydrogenase
LVKVGFIGAGGITKAHISCMKQGVPDAQIVGVSDIDPKRAAEVAQQFGIKSFPNNAALLESGINAVFVCTYPRAHKECVVQAIEAGKHVFCEKPLAPTYKAGLEIAQAVEHSDRQFMIGYLFHFSRSAGRIKSLLDGGDLGELAIAWSQRFGYFRPLAGTWHADPVGGGILDLCTHDIEFLSWLGGRPLAVTATGVTAHSGLECMDTVSITMKFRQGIGTVLSSWASPLALMNIGVAGTKGTVVLRQDGSLRVKIEGNEESCEPGEGPEAPMIGEQRHFIQTLQNGGTVSPGIREALLALEIQDAAEKSWNTGRSVSLRSSRKKVR